MAPIVAAVACGSTEEDAAEPAQSEGTVAAGDLIAYEGPPTPGDSEWLLQSLNGGGAAEGSDITLFHDKAELAVEGGCMGFYLVHKLEDDGIRAVEPGLQSGRVDCGKPQGVQRQAEDILEIMRNLKQVRATEDRFELRGAFGGVAVFVPPAPVQVDPALVGTEWFLTLLDSKKPLPGSRLTLEIDREGVGGFSGCNSFGGAIDKMDEGTLTWSTGPSHGFASTMVGCGEPQESQERAYQDAVAGVRAYRLDGDRLELRDARGRTTIMLREKTRSSFDRGTLQMESTIHGSTG